MVYTEFAFGPFQCSASDFLMQMKRLVQKNEDSSPQVGCKRHSPNSKFVHIPDRVRTLDRINSAFDSVQKLADSHDQEGHPPFRSWSAVRLKGQIQAHDLALGFNPV